VFTAADQVLALARPVAAWDPTVAMTTLAGIGTIEDRAIVVRMRCRAPRNPGPVPAPPRPTPP
jgi:hypothetical protein